MADGRPASRPPLDEGQFARIIAAVKELPDILTPILRKEVQSGHRRQLMGEFRDLEGLLETASVGGFFAMLDIMKPAMVGEREKQWFQNISRYCKRVINSLMGRQLDDPRPVTREDLVDHVDIVASYSQLYRIASEIDKVFPSQMPAASRG